MPSDENKLDKELETHKEAIRLLELNPMRLILVFGVVDRIRQIHKVEFTPTDVVFDESKIPMFVEQFKILVNKTAQGIIFGMDENLTKDDYCRLQDDMVKGLPQSAIVNILYLSMLLAQHNREKGK